MGWRKKNSCNTLLKYSQAAQNPNKQESACLSLNLMTVNHSYFGSRTWIFEYLKVRSSGNELEVNRNLG